MTVPIGSIRLYDRVDPVFTAGVYRVSTTAEVTDAGNPAHVQTPAAPDRLHVEVGGPRFRLGPAEIAAAHPAPGSSGAFGDRLPHIVLGRRTLPWERTAGAGAPWLALVVARTAAPGVPGEVTLTPTSLRVGVGAAVFAAITAIEPADPAEPVTVARFTDAATLRALLPARAELGLLTHVRQVNLSDTALDLGDDDGWFAVVAANRLPRDPAGTGTPYVAILLSLEGRDDLWTLPSTGPAPAVIALASWEFTSAGGGTFAALAAGLDLAAFGPPGAAATVPLPAVDRAGQPGTADYRGPLLGVPPEDGPALPVDDPSATAAFELGRLLGTADGRFSREIVAWHRDTDASARSAAGRQVLDAALATTGPARRAAHAESPWDAAGVAAALRAAAADHPRSDPWRVHPAARARREPS